MKKRRILLLCSLLLALTLLCISAAQEAMAYSVNTDDDKADYDGEYTFTGDGDFYGYESYIVWTSDWSEYVGARRYKVTLPDSGRLKVEVTSSTTPHMVVFVQASGSSDELSSWTIKDSGQGLKLSEQTDVLPPGTYVVTFGFSHDLEVAGLELPGRTTFYHNLTWKKEALPLKKLENDPKKIEALPETASLAAVSASGITMTDQYAKKQSKIKFSAAAGAADYIVAWKNISASEWNYRVTAGKTVAVIDKLKKGGLYQVKIAAYASGYRSRWSEPVCRYFSTVSGKVKAGKKSFTVTLTSLRGASGYRISYALKKSMKGQKTKTGKKTKVTVKGLKKGKKYYVRFCPYRDFRGDRYLGVPVTKTVTVKK